MEINVRYRAVVEISGFVISNDETPLKELDQKLRENAQAELGDWSPGELRQAFRIVEIQIKPREKKEGGA